MAQRLPFLELKAWKGLYTKASSEVTTVENLTVAENIDFVKSYGAIAKIDGNRRILNSIYREDGLAKKVTWLGFHKSSDLDGSIIRHVLMAAGSTINRVEESGNITTLLTGRKKNKFHTSDRVDRFTFISNQNPDLVGDGDDMIKYDGAVITKWGLVAPGSQEEVLDTFYSAHKWTTTNCSVSEESTVTRDGHAVRIDKTVTTSPYFAIQRSLGNDQFYVKGNSRTVAQGAPNRINVQLYIPRGTLTPSETDTTKSFATSGPAVAIQTINLNSSGVPANAWRFDYPIGNLVEGWNQLDMDFTEGTPGSTSTAPLGGAQFGVFNPDNHSVDRIKFEFYLNRNATTVSGIRLDRLVKLDEGTPIVTALGGGSLTGNYNYKVTFNSKFGQESNSGPASVTVAASGNSSFYLRDIPISTDPQVTSRRLYRTVANGSIYLFDAEIPDNTTTKYEDFLPDGSLANTIAPARGDFSDDNSPPPKAGIVKQWKKTMFLAGDPLAPETLYFSEDNEPESFPVINALEFDEKITAIYESYSGLTVETETAKWQVIGDNPDFAVDKIIKGMGCVGRRAAGTAKVVGFSVDRDGMRLYDNNEVKKISEAIRDKYEDSTISDFNRELIHAVHFRGNNSILQFNPTNTAGDYNSIFMYQYGADEVAQGNWSTIVTPSGAALNFQSAVEVEDRNGKFRLYAGGADGMIYELFYPGAKNWISADGTIYAIHTKFRSPYIRAGESNELSLAESHGAIGRVSPRYVELRQSDIDASTWTVTLEMADGPSQPTARSTSALSMAFGTNNSMIRQAVPQSDITPAQYMRIQIENNETSVAGTIVAARIYFNVQEGQFELITTESA